MRRKALQMADLCNRRTHSTQTDLSHFRRENETQTTLPTYACNPLCARTGLCMCQFIPNLIAHAHKHISHTLPFSPAKDGSMPGVGTQTGIEKGTNVERTTRYFSGLRGKPDTKAKTVEFTLPEHVVHGNNLPLNQPDPREIVGLDV